MLIEQEVIEQIHPGGFSRCGRLVHHRLVLGMRIVFAGRAMLVKLVIRLGGLQVKHQQARHQ
jgi:hypothetical protein